MSDHTRESPSIDLGSAAVIGAGVAGLACAQTLREHGVAVTVFEKSRGLGGRCATRREGSWRFDHGAQFFTVRHPAFSRRVQEWQRQGVVTPWTGTLGVRERGAWRPAGSETVRMIGVPGMSAIGGALAEGIDVQRATRVSRVAGSAGSWNVLGEADAMLGRFDAVLACTPPAQADSLIAGAAPDLARDLSSRVMQPTWATMVVLPSRPAFPWDGAFLNDDDVLGWIARDASKPDRGPAETWVLHATHAWSIAHLEDDEARVCSAMLAAFQEVIGSAPAPVRAMAHRWRYASPAAPGIAGALYDTTLRIGAAGDWCAGARVEGAFLGGIELAHRVLGHP